MDEKWLRIRWKEEQLKDAEGHGRTRKDKDGTRGE
jgi:hypothetical protein